MPVIAMSLSYLEDFDSQIPAVRLLLGIGWQYLSRDEALQLRSGRQDQVVLTGVLRPWLAENNTILTKGLTHPFNENNINEALRRLTDIHFDGLVRTNENLYNLLTIGTSLEQTVNGDRKGRQLKYIDWRYPENNLYHVTTEFSVEKSHSRETRRVDLVLFVNGIPFVVIECKRRDKDKHVGVRQTDAAISRLITYQNNNEIPQLFQYAQLLLSTSVDDIKYATVNTPHKFWSVWREEGNVNDAVHQVANQPIPADIEKKLFSPREEKHNAAYINARKHFKALWAEGDRLPTEQDRTLYAMLRPQRLLELVYGYVVFDAGVRKIARYPQYFAVKATMERVSVLYQGRRIGGVIWHTTGSGKSLTMVMLAKALAIYPDIVNPRIVLVTDRIDLDKQIGGTFNACGKTASRAKTGEELVTLVKEGKAGVITTIIDKFNTVMAKHKVIDTNPDIFVLVDEGHRSNYGATASAMRRVFPNAAFIGFTGTPLMKKHKNTAREFGGIIHRYTMRQAAVEDHTVLPLLYEGRIAELEINKQAMQVWFERMTESLSKKEKADLKRKMASKEVVNQAEQRLKMIAYDISKHFQDNFQGTGFKAQLAADYRSSAILYRRFLNDLGMVRCEVIMSKPDDRKASDSTGEEDTPLVNQFWSEMMNRFGTEKNYVDEILGSFAREDGVDILIVVHKLLTGFDEPRNTVLYVDKPLKGHNILQAIARVNRLFTGKEYGYVIDYRGILGELNEAMQTYDALAEFDAEDVELQGAVIDTHAETAKLPQRHSDLWAVFKQVKNKKDIALLEQHLAQEDRRQDFYDVLRLFQNALTVALATKHFHQDVSRERLTTYKSDLTFFRSLRTSVQQRYAEAIDYSLYEKQIRKVMNSHLQTPGMGIITGMFNIFDTEAFDDEVKKRDGKAAKADMIAHRMRKTITEKMEEDPVFYKKFAELVQKTINDYRQKRIDEAEYLLNVTDYLETLRRGHEEDIPERLQGKREAQAYYGVLSEVLLNTTPHEAFRKVYEDMGVYDAVNRTSTVKEKAAEMALYIEELIDKRKIRDWVHNQDVVRQMQNDIDDYLFHIRDQSNIPLQAEDMDAILERCLSVARKQAGA